ncbi:MAG: hypothetical protein R3Y40_07140 [Eubacteriales bacterium]
MKYKIKDYVPFGMELEKIYSKILIMYLIPLAFSMQFLFTFFVDRASYLSWKNGKTETIYEVIPEMRNFVSYLGNGFVLFPVAMVTCLFLMIPMYRYHFQGSKSIYVMKRLPDARELRRRVVTIPILVAISLFLIGILVFGIYYGIYMIFVPAGSVSPNQGEMLMNVWFNGGAL